MLYSNLETTPNPAAFTHWMTRKRRRKKRDGNHRRQEELWGVRLLCAVGIYRATLELSTFLTKWSYCWGHRREKKYVTQLLHKGDPSDTQTGEPQKDQVSKEMAVAGIFKFMRTRKTNLVLNRSQVWWVTPLIPAFKRLRQGGLS